MKASGDMAGSQKNNVLFLWNRASLIVVMSSVSTPPPPRFLSLTVSHSQMASSPSLIRGGGLGVWRGIELYCCGKSMDVIWLTDCGFFSVRRG